MLAAVDVRVEAERGLQRGDGEPVAAVLLVQDAEHAVRIGVVAVVLEQLLQQRARLVELNPLRPPYSLPYLRFSLREFDGLLQGLAVALTPSSIEGVAAEALSGSGDVGEL